MDLWRFPHLNKNVFDVFNVWYNVLYETLFIVLRILKVQHHIITIVKAFDIN